MKSRIATAVGALAFAAATLVTTTGGASAGTLPPNVDWDATYSATGVKVYAKAHGDYFAVCDTAKNGHSAKVKVSAGTGVYYWMTVTSGSGTCLSHNASQPGYNLPETRVSLEFWGNGETEGHYHFGTFYNLS